MESGSNDPFAYILTIVGITLLNGSNIGATLPLLFKQIFFGIIFGILIAWGALFLLKKTRLLAEGTDTIFVVAVALLSYSLTDLLQGNGYLSVYITGIILGNSQIKNKLNLMHFFDGITALCQVTIFFLIGFLSFPHKIPEIILPAVFITVFLTFIARPLAVFIALGFFALVFKKDLVATEENMKKVASIDNSKTITDKKHMIRPMSVLGLVILGFMLHDIIHIDTYVIAMIGACILMLFEKPTEILEKIEWNTIFFFIGLFIIIGGLEASGGIKLMAEWLLKITNGSQEATSMMILWGSGIISGIIDNIPYTATMSPMLVEIQKTMGTEYTYPLWWVLSLGACLGGNMTIIGAAANVIVSENAAKEGHPIGFIQFMKYGVPVVAMSLIVSSIYIYLRYLH